MKMNSTNRQEIADAPWGVWVWQCSDGEYLGDGDGNFMLLFSNKDDREASRKLSEAARHYGHADGHAVFWAGQRPVTDEEYKEQLMREQLGLVPDPLDVGAIRDEERARKHYNG